MLGRSTRTALLILIAVSIALSACAPAAQQPSGPADMPNEEPTEFVFAHSGPIRSLDAPVTWSISTHYLTNLLYDCLIWRSADGSGYVGQAAERWERTDDVTYRFYLRPGMTFHNGEPLNAEAVKWSIDRTRTREDFQVMPQWAFVKDVIVVDDLTVDITTHEPYAYFEYDISYNGCELLPPKYMEEVGEAEFPIKPVGSGPYKLVEIVPNERYVFEAWDGYWGGRPEVDRVIYQVIPEVQSQVAALLSGQIQMISNVPIPDRDRVSNASGIEVLRGSSGMSHNLYMRVETESGSLSGTYPGYQPVTLDKRIRQAISHALDRNLLAEVQGAATAKLVRGDLALPEVASFGEKYGGSVAADNWYNPDLARQLIKEAGYDPDAGNRPLIHLDAPVDSATNTREVAQTIQTMLQAVGFDVELILLEPSAHREQVSNSGNNRELVLSSLMSPPGFLPVWYSCDWRQPIYDICELEWDEIGEQIRAETDPAKRLQLWEKWWDYYLDFSVTTTIYEIENVYAMSDDFEWTPRADGWMTFRDLKLAK